MFNEKTFGLMKPDGYFINVSRGPVVDEKALIKALKEKRIRGAATDVFECEPGVSEEMAAIENIVITPHVAATVLEAKLNMLDEALSGAYQVLDGRKPHNVVNTNLYGEIKLAEQG
jgi:phosphoglycerate dehydrogenase-like enzyme